MTIDEITEFIEALGGVLTLRPVSGDGTPEIAWGDRFFYYSPDGRPPPALPDKQPFGTVVTKDYPDEPSSGLDREGAFRVNIAAGRAAFQEWTGRGPRDPDTSPVDPSTPDVVIPHPVYGSLGWLAVVNPGRGTQAAVQDLLRAAHRAARARYERRRPS
jgi:hypothetical protein